jgi:predicted RNase H-like nuclease
MSARTAEKPGVGVDGCKGGWIAVSRSGDGPLACRIHPTFEALTAAYPTEAIIAVDMPSGLPDWIGHGGRGPEALVRRHLGERQSSVFSIPSRAAVYAASHPFSTLEKWYADHRKASDVARRTSDPPRGVSIQAFALFSKIREIDALLREPPELRARLIESHPEAAFWRLNGERAMCLPKKIKGQVNPPGMEERRALLAAHGLDPVFLRERCPAGAGADDFLDACAMLLVAERRAKGLAVPFPDPPLEDSHGIPIAIWT